MSRKRTYNPAESAPEVYITAGWPGKQHTMRVRCSSKTTEEVVIEMFAKLGCSVDREVVA